MSVITKDQNGVEYTIDSLSDWETKRGQPAQSNEDLGSFLNYAVGAFTKAGKDPDEAYGRLSQNLFRTAVERGFVQAPEQDDPDADTKLNESFRTFSDQVTQSTLPDYGVLASSLTRTNPEASQAFQSYYEQAKQAKLANQKVLQTPEEEVKFNELKSQFANPDQVRDARILAAKEKGLSYVEYVANDKGDRGVWINPDPAVPKDANSILDSYERSDGLNSPVTLKFAQKQVQKNPGRDTSPYEDTQHAELQQFISGANARAESTDLNVSGPAREMLDALNSAREFQQEAYKQGASIDEASRKEVTEVRPYEYQNIGYGAFPVATNKTFNTGKIAEAKLSSLYDTLKQAEPDNELFAQYTKQQFVNAAGDLVKQSLQVPVNNEDLTKNFVKLSNGTYAPLESTSVLTREKFNEAMDKLGLDDRAKAAAEITRKGYLAQGADAIEDAFEEFDEERYNKFRMEWLNSRTPAQSSSKTDLLEDYMSEASKRKDWNVLAVKTTGVLSSVVKSFNPIVFAIGGGVSNLVGFEKGKDFFLDMAIADAELEARRAKYVNLYGSDLGTGYQFLAQAAPMVADIAISGGVSAVAKGVARTALKETLEAGATATARGLLPTSVNEFAGNIGKNYIAKVLSPETRALFGKSYIRQFGEVGAVAVKADSALVNKVFRGIKADLANRAIPIVAGTVAQRATSFARSAESQYVDTTMAMRSELNADGSRKFTDEQIHKSALTHSLVAGSITALVEQASTKVFGQGADLVSYGNVNLRQLKFYTSRVSSALERSSLGGQEVLGAIKAVVKEAAKESGYGIVKQGTGEFLEEFTDTLAQAVANSMLDNKELKLADALKDAFQSGVIGFGYGTAVPALNNARRINQDQDRQQGVAQSVEGTFLSNVITKLESDGQSPETVAALKNRLKLANRNFQPVSERIPVRAASNVVTALDQVPEQPIVFSPRAFSSAPSGSVATTLAAKKAAELGVTTQELKSIQGSGKVNKQNKTTITPNDVQTYVAQRAARLAQDSNIDWDNQAQVEAYLTRNGVKFVSEGAGESPTVDETRTFKDLKGQLVVINGTRGRIRVEADGVLLDPETNEPPIEVTPNADMPAVEFEGFEGAVAEPSLVSPRRDVRRVALTVSDSGQIVYGKTRYDAPTNPSLVNVKVADNGDIDSMYVLVQNKNGKAVYAYVTGENAQKLRQVYEGRGQESADAFANAVASSKSADVQRNQAAANAKQNQSTQRRKNKRAKNGAPLVSSQGQAAVEAQANYALSLITGRNVNPKLVEELRSVATQLGLDPDTFATTEELFRIVGPELAAGLDLGTFTEAQLNAAVRNVQQGRANTLLDFLVQQEAISPADRATQANHFAKLRAQHRVQFAKHGIKEGQMDVKSVLQSVVRSGKSKMHRETAKFLLSVGVEKCPVFVYNAPNDVGTTGGYLGASKIITLNAASDNGGGIVDALLHELTHFATAEVISNPKNDFERQVRARLLALRAEAQAKIEARYGNAIPENLRYAVEGRMSENESYNEDYAVNEFVAHYFASQTFRLQLDGLAEKGERSLYQKFLDVLASFFSGKRLADPESRALAEAMLDLKKAVAEGNGLPARSVQQILASKAAVARQDGFGPMFGVPNPHPRDSFDWINHQTDSLQDGIFSEAQLRTLIKTGKFGAFTAENPDVTVPTEEANAAFNEQAKQWLAQRGYVADIVVGRYGNGENSFLVDGFTDQDAVDFANEFGQESMATDNGLFYQDGMYQPRDGEELDTPADEASDDNYFTNVRTTEGKIITVRVMYKEDKEDSGLRYSKDLATDTVSENLIVKQVQNQKEFATVISKDTSKPFVLDGSTLVVNEDLVNEVYGAYAFEEQSSLVERDLAVAVAHELAMQRVGDETRVAFEDSGLNAAQVIERAASNDLTASDLQDLLGLGERATDYVAATFAEIGLRNDGQNERLAVTQNRLGDLFRYLQRKGEDIPQDAQSFSSTNSDTDLAIAERLRPVVPTNYFSKAYTGFNAQDLKPGQALGTRNPTGKSATESGLDPMSLIGLDVMARDPKGYRTNALYLTEYPIVAREFPKIAKLVRGLRTEHEKTGSKIRVNADQIKRYKKALKDLLTVEKVKATDAQFQDALLLKKGGLTGQAGKDFAKKQASLEKCLTRSKELKALKTKQKSEMTKTLAGFATDPEHPIATLAPQIYNVVIKNTQSNLEALINLFPKNLRNVAKLWYDGANKIANEFGVAYAQDVEQASGVLAVFSPQKDWFMNIALAERTMKIWHQQVILGNPNAIVWGPEMTAQWLKRGGEPQITTEATDSSLPIYEKGKVKAVYDSNGEHVFDEQGNPMFTGWSSANAEAGRNKAREILKLLEGRALKDLAIENQARFIRMYSEVNDAPAFMKYAPDGTNTQQASRSETSGKETRLAWGSYSTVQKAIRIMSSDKATKLKVVSKELGNMHKVRSFYNNIVDPNNEDGHVTMDTHAVAALYWQALSGNSFEVSQNFGSSNVTNNSILGVNGMYAANAEAYRDAAKTFGLLPREIQSITWEAVRLLFTAKWKSNKKNVDAVRAVWDRYEKDKKFTIEDARAAVYQLATGKDINEAFANTEDLGKSLGFPSWAEVELRKGEAGEVPLEQAAPTIQRSRASVARHTELESKFNAGTITGSDRNEAAKIVAKTAVETGYAKELWHGSSDNTWNEAKLAFDSGYAPYSLGLQLSSSEKVASKFGNVRKFFVKIGNTLDTTEGSPKEYNIESIVNRLKNVSPEELIDSNGFESIDDATDGLLDTISKLQELGAQGSGQAVLDSMTSGYAHERSRLLRASGFDTVVHTSTDAMGGQLGGSKKATTYGILDPSQIKSSEPFTGVPLNQRFDTQNNSIRFSRASVTPQIDTEYLAAVEAGDTATAQRMVDAAAKAAGYTVKAYHTTPSYNFDKDGPFTEFDEGENYFSKEPMPEYGDYAYSAYLKLENPYDFQGGGYRYEDGTLAEDGEGEPVTIGYLKENGDVTADIIERGFDGAVDGPEFIVVFSPEQIKSADPVTRDAQGNVIPLSERFNAAKPDIRYSRATTKEGILNQLSIPKVAVNPPNGKPLYVTGYHGGTFDGRTPMKASSEGVYGYGYYTTPDATRSVDYAKEARKEKGQAEVTTFDVLFMKPLVVKVSKVEFGPALVFEALGLPQEKALAKTVHLFEEYGNIGKHFKSLGEKQGYDGLVILKSDGTISESVAWTRDSLTVDDNAPTIQFSRAALAPTTEQESKAFASATKNKRSGELAVAAVRLAEGQIDNETFSDLVEVLDPWVVKGAQAIPPIEQVKRYIVARRDGKVLSADEEEKIGKVMADLGIPEGQLVDWRIDIPTYNRSLEAGEVTYAITAHKPGGSARASTVLGYTTIARVKNGRVVTRVEKGSPISIAQGGGKFPLATVQGENVKIDRLPAGINDPEAWAEIAYNPARSSEFVDVRTKQPVLTFDDAIMVGSRVFMKNPTYDSKPRYQQPRVNLAAEPTGQIDLRYSRAATPQMDTNYTAAVAAGDIGAAQSMVNSAAVNAGYSEQTYYRGQRKFLDTIVKPTRTQKPSAVADFINKFFPTKASRGMAWLTDSKFLANKYALTGDYKLSAMPSALAQRPDLISEEQYGRYSGSGVVQSAKLDLSNSLQVDGNGSVWTEVQFEGKKLTSDQVADIAKARGFDSVVITNVKDGFTGMAMNETATIVAVFEDTKIKSADAVTYDNNGTAIPISQRFNQAVPSIRYSKSSAPARFRGKEVQLTHWSFDSELETTDPNMHGTGGIGSEKDRKRDYKKIYQPRTYFGYSSYVREYIIGQFRYQIKVAGDSLYDYDADPLDLFPSRDERVALGYARFDDRAATTLYEKAIKDKGFAGYVSKTHTAGVLFGQHKVTKVPDSDRSLALNPKPKEPKILLSRALTAVTSPDIESAYRVSLDDLAINEVTGEYNFGNKLTRLLRASGNLDPRMYEAKQYQERAMKLANQRVAGLTKTFLGALKKEPTVDLDDVNVALGTTAPTVAQADRAAAKAKRDAELEAINVQHQQSDQAYARYKQGTVKARADYATHQDVKLYQREVTTLQADLANSPEKQTRTAAITAANAAYALEIQAARAKGVRTAMVAQQQALFRLEQNNPRVAEVVTEFRSAIDSLSQQLVESLGPNDPMRAVVTENLGVYLTRTYQIHHDEGYVEKIKNDPTFAQARQEARDFFEKAWVNRTFKSWRSNDLYAVFSDAEVRALVEAEARAQSIGSIELDNFIEQHGETPEIPGKVLNKTDLTRFMEKGEVPRELVAILGERQNPVENAMRTYSNLSTFVGTQRLLNQFAQVGLDNGFLVTADEKAKDPEKYRLYEPLLNSTKTLGGEPLSNYYAPPEVKEAFKISFSPDRKAPKSDAAQLIYQIELLTAQAIGKSLSMLTLGSAGFYTRNMVSNVFYMGANGFIASPANIADSIKGLNEIYGTNFLNRAAQMLPEFARPDEKFSLSELGPLGADLIALGLNDSINGGVLKDLFYGMSGDPVNFLAKLEETIRNKGKVASATLTAVKAPYQAVSSAFDTFASAAEAIDLMYKFAYYSHEVKVLTEANAYNTTKWTETQIKQLAARTVRKTTQGRSEVAAVAKAFQASPLATLMNSYFRFTAETVRLPFAITSVGFKEFNSGNPVLRARGKKRLAGFGVVLALSAVPEILKAVGGGFEDDQEESIRNSLPAWAKDVNYYFAKDPQDPSKIKMWNLTYVHPFSLIADPFMRSAHLMLNGRTDETPAVLLGAVADAFFSPQIAVEAIAKARNNTNDQGGKIWYENDSTPEAAFKVVKYLANSAYRLKSPQKFLQAFEAYTNNSIYDQDARLATALELVANEFSPFQTRRYDLVKLAHQAFGKIKRDQDAVAAERGKFKTEAPLSSQQVEDVYVSLEDARLFAARKLQKTVSGFKKLGVTEQELKRQANDVGISKERYNQIINRNVVDRVVFEKDMFSEMLERGGEANGQARVDYLKQAIQKRPRFIPVNP